MDPTATFESAHFLRRCEARSADANALGHGCTHASTARDRILDGHCGLLVGRGHATRILISARTTVHSGKRATDIIHASRDRHDIDDRDKKELAGQVDTLTPKLFDPFEPALTDEAMPGGYTLVGSENLWGHQTRVLRINIRTLGITTVVRRRERSLQSWNLRSSQRRWNPAGMGDHGHRPPR